MARAEMREQGLCSLRISYNAEIGGYRLVHLTVNVSHASLKRKPRHACRSKLVVIAVGNLQDPSKPLIGLDGRDGLKKRIFVGDLTQAAQVVHRPSTVGCMIPLRPPVRPKWALTKQIPRD
ncbi:hypothetical protein ACLOJK_010538 [Asimina triloba]